MELFPTPSWWSPWTLGVWGDYRIGPFSQAVSLCLEGPHK